MGICLPGGNGDQPVLWSDEDLLPEYAWYLANWRKPDLARGEFETE